MKKKAMKGKDKILSIGQKKKKIRTNKVLATPVAQMIIIY